MEDKCKLLWPWVILSRKTGGQNVASKKGPKKLFPKATLRLPKLDNPLKPLHIGFCTMRGSSCSLRFEVNTPNWKLAVRAKASAVNVELLSSHFCRLLFTDGKEKLGFNLTTSVGTTSSVAIFKLAGCPHNEDTNEIDLEGEVEWTIKLGEGHVFCR